jgi:hypothetical protein
VGRVIGTFFSPTPTFQSIAVKPSFLLPLLIWMALAFATGAVMQPKVDYDRLVRSSLEKRGQNLPEERIQSIVEQQKKFSKIAYTAFPIVVPWLITLIVTLVFLGVFKAFGWDFTFKQGFGATAHAFLPGMLAAIGLIFILRGQETVDPRNLADLFRSNLGFLSDPQSSPVVHSLLQSIDLFSFWTIGLLAIGYSTAARTSRKSALMAVIGVWALYVLGKAGLAALLPH